MERLSRVYMKESVLEASRKRLELVFDQFENITVSVSSGKDSTVLYWLALQEAQRRSRRIDVFFLDQEAEYMSSVTLIEGMMGHPNVRPFWYQVPLQLTNATSYMEDMFKAWEVGKSWMREKHPLSIKEIQGEYPQRFYGFFKWLEGNSKDTAFLIGLRTEESLNRLRAVVQNPGWGDIRWSTKTTGTNTYRFYPLYDWSLGDIWKFIHDNGLPYNAVYDKMFRANKNFYRTMRVSNLIHEKSFKCLGDLQVYEPNTYDKLVERLSGIRVAALYAGETSIFHSGQLPKKFTSWLQFRNYLLETAPLKHRDRFSERFKSQPETEEMCRRQVRQIMLNDYENNLKVDGTSQAQKKEDLSKWWDLL